MDSYIKMGRIEKIEGEMEMIMAERRRGVSDGEYV